MSATSSLLDNIVSISSFGRGKASMNFEKVKSGPLIVMKNNTPEAVIVTADEYKRLVNKEEDYDLLVLALERLETTSGKTITHSELLESLSITENDIDDAEDVEFE